MSDLAASLPPPTPLRRGLLVHFRWGEQAFEFIASAAVIRAVFWDDAGRDVLWLHCKAIQTSAIGPDGGGGVTNYLIPADYVTRAEPGPSFRVTKSMRCRDLGVFPPSHPAPADAVPLAELERVIAGLVDASLN